MQSLQQPNAELCQAWCMLIWAVLLKISWVRVEHWRHWRYFPTSLCGVLAFDSASRPPPSASHRLVLTHNLHTHNLLTHNLLTHNSHTQLTHNLLTYNLLTHNLLTYNLLTYNLLTHNLLTHNLHTHNLLTHNLLTHNLLTHNLLTHNLHTHNLHTHNLLTHNLLTHNLLTHNLLTYKTSTFVSRGRRGTYGTGLALVARSVLSGRRGRRGFLRGRRGTWRHVAALCVAGVALWDIHLRFTWQAWHVSHWAGSGGALGSQRPPWSPRLFAWQAWHLATCSCTLRGRRGTLRHPPSFYVAGVARMALSWLWWRARFSAGAVVAAAFCVAGVALGDM